jgi:RNA polymerase sigma-70 factor (ECF subfamily)
LDETRAWDWVAIRRRCAGEARRILRNQTEAEDVVQEAMMRAWSRRGSCQSPQAPIPWCLQITRNEAFRRLDRRVHAADHALADLPDRRASDEPDRVIDRVDIGRALACLRPDERILIALRYSCDWSQPEIARALDIPEGTAKVRLHRVRKRLGTLIEVSP